MTELTDFHLDRPGALIAALPAVLGFVPERSLVLLTVEDGELGCVLRADLAADLPLRELAELAASGSADAAIAVIVDDAAAGCTTCDDEHRRLAADLGAVLAEHGIELADVHVVDRVAAGGRWHCADGCGAGGEVADPTASPLAAAAVLDGRQLYPRRDDLARVVQPGDAEDTDRLRALVVAAGTPSADRPAHDARVDVERVVAAASALAAGRGPCDEDVAAIAVSLADTRVRDTLYALAAGRDAARAEDLWAVLARRLPVPWRAEALTLLAFSAYARGDGPLAGVALDGALTARPGHRMAAMLDRALRTGMRPAQIRELARSGYRQARLIGVTLPPSDERRAG